MAQKKPSSPKLVYRIENDDVHILAGKYSGSTLKELWATGPEERDYIFQFLYKKDETVRKLINTLCCK